MRDFIRSAMVAVLALLVLVGCTAMTGKTLGQNIDDASITAAVKAKLLKDGVTTLTRVDVDTSQGVVYLTGVVGTATMKRRAGDFAWQVKGVRDVVNNLKIQEG